MSLRDDLVLRVNDVLRRRSDLSTAHVRVGLDGETVLLEGTVDDVWSAAHLEEAVRAVPGVAAVRTRLAIRPDIAAEAEAKTTEFGDPSRARAATGRGLKVTER